MFQNDLALADDDYIRGRGLYECLGDGEANANRASEDKYGLPYLAQFRSERRNPRARLLADRLDEGDGGREWQSGNGFC